MDDPAAERMLAAYVRRKRFEALLLASALVGSTGSPTGAAGSPTGARGGGFDRMMEMLG